MFDLSAIARRLLFAGLMVGAFGTPLAAAAQELPSYARAVEIRTDETIHGRIASVDGAFTISIDDDRGFVDSVRLHQGTIINPTGLSLSVGMTVTILGYNGGNVFNANEIDTPYSYTGAIPTPVFYGPGYWCPGFAYGYGPSFSLAIVIGNGYRFEHHPFYGRPWDGSGYFGGYVGHRFEGHEFVGERRGFGGEHRSYTGDVRALGDHTPAAFAGRTFAGRSFGGRSYDGSRSLGGESRATFGHVGATSAAIPAPYAGHAGQVNTNRSFGSQPRGAFGGGYQGTGAMVRSGGMPQGAPTRGNGISVGGGMMRSGGGPAAHAGGPAPHGGPAPQAGGAPHGGGIRH